jgi:hypothetical protein
MGVNEANVCVVGNSKAIHFDKKLLIGHSTVQRFAGRDQTKATVSKGCWQAGV